MRTSIFAVVILLAGPACAHDLWLEKEPGGLVLNYGHKHSGHEGAQSMVYRPEWVKEALCFDEQGARVTFDAQAAYPYRMRGECAAAWVMTSSGYWTKTPYGTENVPKGEARMAIKSWLSFESVKRLDRWSAALSKSLTQGLEITSLNDPLALHEGDKLRLLITFEGQPVEGAVVAYDGKPRGESGADGAVNLRIQHGGFQVVQASLSRPDTSGKADEVVHTANLNFELAEK
jgi:nickel transport protein